MEEAYEFFDSPIYAPQRQYEALRAYFYEKLPANEVAQRFGYSENSLYCFASDFKKLKKIINTVIKEFDHQHLNRLSFFKKMNPTSENIAQCLYTQVKPHLKKELVSLKSVSVWESKNSKATYYE